MGEDRLHVVFGTGQVGRALAACLAGRGLAVRAVTSAMPEACNLAPTPIVKGSDGSSDLQFLGGLTTELG